MLQLERSRERKLDTRLKIQLGGLVVKAGLRDQDKAFILGALIDAANKLDEISEYQRLIALGQKAFQNDSG